MDDSIIIIAIVLPTIFLIVIALVSIYLSRKRLENVITKLGLVQGAQYDIITNNGNKFLNLTYDRIAYGNKSQNGNINIYFIRDTKYRGTIIQKEVMIKYENIWQIYRTNASSSNAGE